MNVLGSCGSHTQGQTQTAPGCPLYLYMGTACFATAAKKWGLCKTHFGLFLQRSQSFLRSFFLPATHSPAHVKDAASIPAANHKHI